MKNLILFVLALIFILTLSNSHAYVKMYNADIRLATQVVLEKQLILNPVAANTNGVISAHAGATSAAAVTLSSGLTNPSVPRNLVITPGGTTADVAACVIVVNGKDIHNDSISESLTFANDASTAQTGTRAFKSISSVVFPASCEDGGFAATWSIGFGEKLGLNKCLDNAGDFAWSTVSGAYESTRATVTANASSVSLNTADFNGTMNGSADFNAYYVQNFRCL